MAESSKQKPRGYSTICLPINKNPYPQVIDSGCGKTSGAFVL